MGSKGSSLRSSRSAGRDASSGSGLNYTPEMNSALRAMRNVIVDNDVELRQLVDSIVDNEPMNHSPETLRLKKAIDNLVTDTPQEKKALLRSIMRDM